MSMCLWNYLTESDNTSWSDQICYRPASLLEYRCVFVHETLKNNHTLAPCSSPMYWLDIWSWCSSPFLSHKTQCTLMFIITWWTSVTGSVNSMKAQARHAPSGVWRRIAKVLTQYDFLMPTQVLFPIQSTFVHLSSLGIANFWALPQMGTLYYKKPIL